MGDPDKINPRDYLRGVKPYGYIVRMDIGMSTPDYWSGSGWNMHLENAMIFKSREEAAQSAPFEEQDRISAASTVVPIWKDDQGTLVESAPLTRKQITETKTAGEVITARIWEAYDKAMQDFVERYDRNLEDLASGLKDSGGQGRVPWPRVPAARLKRIWLDYGNSRVVRDEKGLEEIADRVLDNIARLRAATDMMGHSQMDARSFLDDMGHAFTDEEWDDWMSHWMTDEHGNWVLSDYGMEPLEKLYQKIYSAPTAEQKLQWVDRALNITHQRSDLAALFVEGGSKTLQHIFNQGGYTSENEPLKESGPDEVDAKDVFRELEPKGFVVKRTGKNEWVSYDADNDRYVWTIRPERKFLFGTQRIAQVIADEMKERLGPEYVEHGFKIQVQPVFESHDPDDVNPREYVMRGWQYALAYFDGQDYVYFDEFLFRQRDDWTQVSGTPWVANIDAASKFDEQQAKIWLEYWTATDVPENKDRYSLQPVAPDSILPPRNVHENEEPEDVDPDVPVNPKQYLLRLDFRGEERIKELTKIGPFNGSGYWYIPNAYKGYEADFYSEANYKYFTDKYKFLSSLDGGYSNAVGFDKDNYPEEYASFEEFISQIDETDWEQFMDDVRVADEGMTLDEDEANRLEQEETARYVKEDFLPDFKRELKKKPQFQDSFAQFVISQLNENTIWQLMQVKQVFPESEGGGHVFLRDEDLARHLEMDELLELFEDVPLKQQWEDQKRSFYQSEHGRLFDKFLNEAATANPSVNSIFAQFDAESTFALLKSVVPDSNFASHDLPRWDEVEQKVTDQLTVNSWVVMTQMPTDYWEKRNWARYVEEGLRLAAQLAVEKLPTWSRPIPDHPELPLGESGPDDVNPADYLQSVQRYWGIGHRKHGGRIIWYTGNPWDRWSFEIEHAKQFKSKAEAESFQRNFEANLHVEIQPLELPDLYTESQNPDDINPREYLGKLHRRYVARIDAKYVTSEFGGKRVETVPVWFSKNPYGWWPDKEKATVFDDPAQMNEVYLGLPYHKRKFVIIEPADIVGEAKKMKPLPPDEDIDYKSWVIHGGYDSGKELYSDETLRILLPSTIQTLHKYGFPVSKTQEEWDHFREPGPIFIIIPTNGKPWCVREWYDDLRQLNEHGSWYTVFPDDLVKTQPEGVKAGQVLAKYFKKKLKDDFDKYFKFVFGFGGLGMVKGYLRRMRPGSDGVMDNSIAIQAITNGDVKTASKFFQYPADLMNREGVWLLYNDYEDLADMFMEGSRVSYRESARQIFSLETHDWFDWLWSDKPDIRDMTRYLTPEHYKTLREVLVGRSILVDDEPVLLTPEVLKQYTDKEIEDLIEDYEDYQDGNDLEEIVETIRRAGSRALQTIYEDAYFKGYLGVVESEFGSKGVWKQVNGKEKLAYFVTWQKIKEWLNKYADDKGEPYSGRIDTIAEDTLSLEAAEEYHGSLSDDKQVVIDALSDELHELDAVPYAEHVDPNQTDLFDYSPEDRKVTHRQVYNEHYPNGATVAMTGTQWKQFVKEHPEQISKEAWEAHVNGQPPPPALGESADPDDAHDFLQRMPMHYIIVQNWSSPTRDYVDYWSGDRGGWSAEPDHALKFTSYDEAKAEQDKMFARGSSLQHQYEVSIKPVYESADPDAVDPRAAAMNLAPKYAIVQEVAGQKYYWIDYAPTGPVSVTPRVEDAERFLSRSEAEAFMAEHGDRMRWSFYSDHHEPGQSFSNFQGYPRVEAVYDSVNESLLQEAAYKYAVALIDAPRELSDHIINWGKANIPDEWLFVDEDGGKGREAETHITVKYGLTVRDVPDVLREIVATTRPFPVFFEKISLFNTSPDYDVVKIGIESPWLRDLNKRITAAIPHEDKHPVYNPHCTIAYVKKGVADKLAGLDIFGPGGIKPQFTAYNMEFKGACEDSDDPSRVKEVLHFSTTKKPQTESEDPDAVSAKEYLTSLRRPFGISYISPNRGHRIYYWRSNNPRSMDYLNNWTANPADAQQFRTAEEAEAMVQKQYQLRKQSLSREGMSDVEYEVAPLPAFQHESDPDDVNPRDYLNSVAIDICRKCQADLGKPFSIRREYVNKEGDILTCLGHMTKEGFFEPDHGIYQDITGYDLPHDSDFCDHCGASLLGDGIWESDPDDVDPHDYLNGVPVYYHVLGRWKPEFLERFDAEARQHMIEYFWFDSAGGTQHDPVRMSHRQALTVKENAEAENPFLNIEVVPAENQSQMYWQGRPYPALGESADPDVPQGNELDSVPAKYIVKYEWGTPRQGTTTWYWGGFNWEDRIEKAHGFHSRASAEMFAKKQQMDKDAMTSPESIAFNRFSAETIMEGDPDEVNPKDYIETTPVHYLIQKIAPGKGGAGTEGWYWNKQWGWRSKMSGADHYPSREAADLMISARGLGGIAKVVPVIEEGMGPDPFGSLPFPSDSSRIIQFLRNKRHVKQLL